MIYFSGDIHGSPWGVKRFCEKQKLAKDDILILLGDVGANYYGDWRDDEMKKVLAKLVPTILCIHGNHERRPWNVPGYRETVWHGGKVLVQDQYPNLLFARDGEIFSLNGLNYSEEFLDDEDTVYTDEQLEAFWSRFGDVPMDPETERMEDDFLSFPQGTHREEIWHWFDKRHSKGVAFLLYGETKEKAGGEET